MQLNNSLLEQRIIKELEENPTLEIAEEAKFVGDNILSLPFYPSLKKNEVNYICKKICEFF